MLERPMWQGTVGGLQEYGEFLVQLEQVGAQKAIDRRDYGKRALKSGLGLDCERHNPAMWKIICYHDNKSVYSFNKFSNGY